MNSRWAASGQLSEVLRHQGDHYQEEATRRLRTLTAVAAGAVWALTGLFIIVLIFRLFFNVYLRQFDALGVLDAGILIYLDPIRSLSL